MMNDVLAKPAGSGVPRHEGRTGAAREDRNEGIAASVSSSSPEATNRALIVTARGVVEVLYTSPTSRTARRRGEDGQERHGPGRRFTSH